MPALGWESIPFGENGWPHAGGAACCGWGCTPKPAPEYGAPNPAACGGGWRNWVQGPMEDGKNILAKCLVNDRHDEATGSGRQPANDP